MTLASPLLTLFFLGETAMPVDRVVPSEFVIAHAPWSTSKADTASQCPKKFWFSYTVKHAKPASYNADALVGKAVHSIIEFALGGKPVDHAVKLAMEEHNLCTPEQSRVSDMVPSVSTFLRRFETYCHKYAVADVLVEKKLAAGFQDQPLKFFDNKGLIRGVLDIGLVIPNANYFTVLDHKTGNRRSLEYYSKQFEAYYYLVKVNYPQITHIVPGIHWVQEGDIEMGKPILLKDLDTLYNTVMTRLNTATTSTHTIDQTVTGPLCKWCDYRAVCPAHAQGNGTGDDRQDEQGVNEGATL